MPFRSKRQQRAMYAGAIPGLTKEDAREWSKDTDFSKLPERAPAEKGKPTMRSKKANGDMLQYFLDHPKKAENYLDRKERERKRRGKTASFEGLEEPLAQVFKAAALGTAVVSPGNVGRLRGMMTANALKAPQNMSAASQAIRPNKGVVSSMTKLTPH